LDNRAVHLPFINKADGRTNTAATLTFFYLSDRSASVQLPYFLAAAPITISITNP
jgi:hypothetical protein